jgi:acyl-CoA synthetase (AMP-forming)/AMP-acid ligase II
VSKAAATDSDHSGTIRAVFEQFVISRAAEDAVINDEQRINYAQLGALVDNMAAFLAHRGVRKGDRVAILSNARAEVVVVFLACARIGAIYLGLSTRLAHPELAYVLSDSRPSFVFSVDTLDGRDYGRMIRDVSTDIGSVEPVVFSAVSSAFSSEFLSLLDDSHSSSSGHYTPTADDPIVIIYTSGSTGAPKGALLSNRNLVISARAYMKESGLLHPRAISQLPIDHVGYVLCEMTAILLAGGALIQLPRFDVQIMLGAIERHRATLALCIPTMIQRMVDSGLLEKYDLSSLEFLWWAGPLPLSSAEIMRRYCKVLAVSYGMTEASGTITFSRRGDSDQVLCSTVGRPHPLIELRIAQSAGVGEPGEIEIRGSQVMLGYWNKPDATKAAFTSDGWFKTGDLGLFKGSSLAIVGRSKEMIRSGGYNILPAEVEVALEEHNDIVMAFVGGVPDPVFGEAVHAIVHVREGAVLTRESVADFLKKSISSIKVPKQIHFRRDLPLLANGKLDRPGLRKQLADLAAGTGK